MTRNFLSKCCLMLLSFVLMSACSSAVIPSNYLSPNSIKQPQKINKQSISPNLIPVNANLMASKEGKGLLEAAMKPQAYRVGSFDYLNIIVWGHPEFSTLSSATLPAALMSQAQVNPSGANTNPAVIVDNDGEIFFPYVGTLKVSGLTVKEIQRVITRRLSQYIRDPQVSVQVSNFRNRNVYVLGEVNASGMQALTDKPLTLMEALSSAGGVNPNSSDPSHIYLIRGNYLKPNIFWVNGTSPQSLMIAEHFALQENDIVYVSSASLTGWNRFINQILPSLMTYVLTKDIIT